MRLTFNTGAWHHPEISHLQQAELAMDWRGHPAAGGPSMILGKDCQSLWLIVDWKQNRQPPIDSTAVLEPAVDAQFVEGLWHTTVAEAFIACQISGRYLELNLAPSGNWWAAGFSSPRQRLKTLQINFPLAKVFTDPAREISALCLDYSLISKQLGGPLTHSNLTAIKYCNADQPVFYSLVQLPGPQADFHQPALFDQIHEVIN
jgi:hypothetical protein